MKTSKKIKMGNRIKLVRKNKGMTQQEFGELFNSNNGVVSRWERNLIIPDFERIIQIAEIGEVTLDWLVLDKLNSVENATPGGRIRQLRLDMGLSYVEFGVLILGANKSMVYKWETDVMLPNNDRLKMICDIGNVTADYILFGRR